mmetsp:Transcript_20091/g.47849  ORF Transcript_20091/g.47849 Transcript_20091/m.47849 type:complete len:708 (+) Transcript_20091:61-2184(+)
MRRSLHHALLVQTVLACTQLFVLLSVWSTPARVLAHADDGHLDDATAAVRALNRPQAAKLHDHEHVKGHKCVHDKIDPIHKRSIRAKQDHKLAASGRRLGDLSPRPYVKDENSIRIHFHYDWSTVPSGTNTEYLEGLVQDARDWLQDTLSVHRLTTNLRLQQECANATGTVCTLAAEHRCGEFEVPTSFYAPLGDIPGGSGIAGTDLVVFVSGRTTGLCQDTGAQAYAVTCQRDAATDRPLAGWLNFCPAQLQTQLQGDRLRQLQVNTVIHELVHVLGFSKENMAFWRDAENQFRTPRCFVVGGPPIGNGPNECRLSEINEMEFQPPYTDDTKTERYVADTTIKEFVERGHSVTDPVRKIVTPEATSTARSFFGCSSLQGVELENFVKGSSVGTESYSLEDSHLEKRIFFNELMVREQSSTALDAPRSVFTLAILKDSGWYDVKYENADPFTRGRGSGCEYALDKCDINLPTGEYCSDGNVKGQCTPDLSAVGDCNAQVFALNSQGQSPIPPRYQYFANDERMGGRDESMDFCPVVVPYRDGRCDQESSPSWDLEECDSESCSGMRFGSSSICLVGNLWKESELARRIEGVAPNAGCYLIRCVKQSAADTTVWVEIFLPDKSWHNCRRAGIAQLAGDGYDGQIQCPANPAQICEARETVVLDEQQPDPGTYVRPLPDADSALRREAAGWMGMVVAGMVMVAAGGDVW